MAVSIAACCKFDAWFCLCLHDALNFQAAAAMCVGMGSFTDPPNAQGLAHFLGMQSLTSKQLTLLFDATQKIPV
jgi:hypothetical protein